MADREILQRILVVKLADMGDLLTAIPALRALRESFPQARIDALVTPHSAPVLEGSPLVDEVLTFEKHRYDSPVSTAKPSSLWSLMRLWRNLRSRRYDWLFILHHLTTRWGTLKYAGLALAIGARERIGLDNGRGWFLTRQAKDLGFGGRHEVEYWLKVVGLVGAKTENLNLPLSEGAVREAQALLQGSGRWREGVPLVAIHPGSGEYSLARRWPPDRFAQVADALMERYGTQVALLGGPDEAELTQCVASLMRYEAVDLGGKTSIPVLAALLRLCRLFVGNDSGVMHLASAVGTPVVAVFGPSNPLAWGPWGPSHEVVQIDLECSPCIYRGFQLGRLEGCENPECINQVKPEMVLAAAGRLLRG
ncbi:MAG: glycosyltransferase family 9 protein [Anaerolineae bacterium]